MAQDYNENARKWLEGDFDQETKMKVIELRNNDPAGFEDAFYKTLEFGTGGLRGIMGVGTNRMNKYTVGMATQGLSNYILKKATGDDIRVCISYDSRNNSKLDSRRLIAQGVADTQPRYPNDTPAHRQANRRVEIVLSQGKAAEQSLPVLQP
jgi:hypothetical protein